MIGKEFSRLYVYDEWATNKLIDAAEKLEPAKLQKDLGTSFGSLQGTLVHIYGAQFIWLARWKGATPSALPKADEIPDLNELRTRWQKLRVEFREFLNSKTEEQLQQISTYKDLKGNPCSLYSCVSSWFPSFGVPARFPSASVMTISGIWCRTFQSRTVRFTPTISFRTKPCFRGSFQG
jgi:hypothetical protein